MSEVAQQQTVATIPDPKAPIVLGVTKQALAALKKKYAASKVPDASTKDGYQAIMETRRTLVPLRTGVEKEAKIQKEAAQLHITNINRVKDHIIGTIQAIEKPWYDARKAEDDRIAAEKLEAEQAEDRRVAEIEAKVGDIQALTENLLGADLAKLAARLVEAEAIVITDAEFMEFVEPASVVLGRAKEQLSAAVESAKALAEQQKEIDAQSAVMDEQKRVMDEQMAAQKKVIDDQKADLARQASEIAAEKAIAEREKAAQEMAEASAKAAKEKADADAKAAMKNAAALKARLPEDMKVMTYVDELVNVCPPDVEAPELVAVLRAVFLQLSDIREYVLQNTQG
ncbi:MAG: hypothetical protein ACNYZG_09235 [Gammaproteobacteria bacterium]